MCEDLFCVDNTEIIFESSVFEYQIKGKHGNPDWKEAIFNNNPAKANWVVDYNYGC